MNRQDVLSQLRDLIPQINAESTDKTKAEDLLALNFIMDALKSDWIKIGEIGYADLNGGATATTITTVFTAGKPAGSLLNKGLMKVLTPFVSYTNKIPVPSTFATSVTGHTDGVQDVSAALGFTGGVNNPKDFSAGKIGVYISVLDASSAI